MVYNDIFMATAEEVLYFCCPPKLIEETEKIQQVLSDNNIEFILYKTVGIFVVRKSGQRWNNIRALINSIYQTKYSYKKAHFSKVNGELKAAIY